MNLIKNQIAHSLLALLSLGVAGCSTPARIQPLSGGYEEVIHSRGATKDPDDVRISFVHRGQDGKTMLVWPSLYGVDEAINGGLAIFVGDKAYVSSDPNDPRGTKPRLFAVRSPALPLDITDEILWRWSQASGKDFTKTAELFSLVTPVEINGQLRLQLEFYTEARDWPDKSTLQLDWKQVSDIMRDVQEKGAIHKDLRWGTPYIEK